MTKALDWGTTLTKALDQGSTLTMPCGRGISDGDGLPHQGQQRACVPGCPALLHAEGDACRHALAQLGGQLRLRVCAQLLCAGCWCHAPLCGWVGGWMGTNNVPHDDTPCPMMIDES